MRAGGGVPDPPPISNASLALVPLTLMASIPGWSAAPSPKAVATAGDRQEREPSAARRPLERLTDAEVIGLIGAANEEKPMRGPAIRGAVAVVSSYLTEMEVRGLLAAFLKKNGYDAAAGKLGEMDLDAVDGEKRIGVTVVRAGGAAVDADEIAMLKARGEARVLVLGVRDFEYDGRGYFAGRLPTKSGAAHALLAELERFLDE
jgi:hypothetical protein